MKRRHFMQTSLGACYGTGLLAKGINGFDIGEDQVAMDNIRALFPRMKTQTYLNAAGATPLSSFVEAGLRRYETYWRTGQGPEPWGSVSSMMNELRQSLATLIGAKDSEIAFTLCTKAGEQIVLNGLRDLEAGGNIVTNDLHFAGSLHNLIGLKRAGLDVRIVKSRNFVVDLDDMAKAIDDDTTLVTVTYVSNINGRFEPMAELAKIAHAHGAYVYADIIQATGIVPLDVKALDIDFATGNGYKWLFGHHGSGYLYVREELQGNVLQDRRFPGSVRHNYQPWVADPDPSHDDYLYREPDGADRYQAGHVNYLGYCCLLEGLKFIEQQGVEKLQSHSVQLCNRLVERLDPKRFPCISPDLDRSPVVSFLIGHREELAQRLRDANVIVSLGANRMRVSPGIYSNEADIDRLAMAMMGE
ncbi:MAG: aminotransferase class V-fold PLP-dependent enzyme [Planctomycetota bacterium]|nr:aminotransferase class V-fold PLP-dependent enzyme [Planctomycetota bacterium]